MEEAVGYCAGTSKASGTGRSLYSAQESPCSSSSNPTATSTPTTTDSETTSEGGPLPLWQQLRSAKPSQLALKRKVKTNVPPVGAVIASIHVSNFPNVDAIIGEISTDPNTQQQLKLYAVSCVKPGLDYFMSKYTGDLAKQISGFNAARLFVPHKVVHLSPTASSVDSLSCFPFLVPLLPGLKTELPTYLALASGIAVDIEPTVWWKQNKAELPHWSLAFTEDVLIQPSHQQQPRERSLS